MWAGSSATQRSANGKLASTLGATALQRALGAGHQFVDPQVGAVAFEPGDLFLLCTDGLVDGLFDAQILDILHSSQPFGPESNPAQRLVHAAVTQAGRDNTTALVIEAR